MAEMPPTIQPPFHFIWPCGDQKGQSEGHAALELTSRFHLEPQAIGEPPDALGFKLADETMIECYRDHREKNPQPRVSLGVVAALRGSAGQLWVVLAGNTGPATDGIVTAFRECPELATVSVGPNPGDGFWAVVSVTVKEDPSVGRGENREITKVEVKRSPVHFPNALGHSSAAGTVLRKKRRGRPRQVPEGP
jgi:hypothetical protein